MRTWIKRSVVAVVVLGVAGTAGAWYFRGNDAAAVQFRTAKVERGDLVNAIAATGTLQPTETIDVGSQVNGQIQKFGSVGQLFKRGDGGPYRVDYTAEVKAGDLLAQIDATTYQASLLEAKAQLAQANAGVKRAEADKLTATAKFEQAKRDWERAEKIGPGDALAQTTFDTYRSGFEQAEATVAVADAAIVSAKAAIDQADSAVQRAQRNVDYCTINSPVDGTIIDRRVNIGQTVVSSLSASSLFLIAKDLHHMQIWVAVNEADTANIFAGQPVTFTVDALGDRTFKGKVDVFRLNAQMTQNVVTYPVVVQTENPDLMLLPYQTANVSFEVDRRDGVLNVPTGALRWNPASVDQIHPSAREAASKPASAPAGGGGNADGGGEHRRGEGRKPSGRSNRSASKPGTVWIKDGEFVRPVNVTVGISDGASTEVSGDGLSEGTEVVTGVTSAADAPAAGPTNPFLPQMRGGRGGGGGGRR